MKITIEIARPILGAARELARREGVPLCLLVEEGLRRVLAARDGQKPFQLADAGFKGQGLQDGVAEGSWTDVRRAIYWGRGA